MIPFSYHTIGFTAIIIMVVILVIAEIAKYTKEKLQKHNSKKVNKSIGH